MSITIEKSTSATCDEADLSELTDEQLLITYRKSGDRDYFSQLVHRYEQELYSYLRRYLGNSEAAEDAFQTTFLQVHLKCSQFRADRKVRPWLYTIATNQAIDLQRRNKRHRLVSLNRPVGQEGGNEIGQLLDMLQANAEEPLKVLSDGERRDWVRRELATLPDSLRSVVLMIYFQGLKYREAAESLAIPVGTVKSRMHSAILKLNDSWQAMHPETI